MRLSRKSNHQNLAPVIESTPVPVKRSTAVPQLRLRAAPTFPQLQGPMASRRSHCSHSTNQKLQTALLPLAPSFPPFLVSPRSAPAPTPKLLQLLLPGQAGTTQVRVRSHPPARPKSSPSPGSLPAPSIPQTSSSHAHQLQVPALSLLASRLLLLTRFLLKAPALFFFFSSSSSWTKGSLQHPSLSHSFDPVF